MRIFSLTVVQLRRADAARLLEFVADAQAVEGPEPFTTDLLDRLAAVTESDFATYMEHDAGRVAKGSYLPCSYEARFPTPPSDEWEVQSDFGRTYAKDDILTLSDHIDRPSRMRFESVPWAKFYGLVDSLSIRMRPAVLVLSRQERDFTARECLIGQALRPHAASLVRQARSRRLLAALQAAVDSADEGDTRGFLILQGSEVIEYASPPAQRLLTAWFGHGFGDRLPAPIGDWLASGARDHPLQVESNGTRLVVEAPGRDGLVIAEERARPPLTAREVDVLRGLAAGKSTAEIARELWVTPATVSKHLEHVYRKLGVSSRTAALAALGVRADALR